MRGDRLIRPSTLGDLTVSCSNIQSARIQFINTHSIIALRKESLQIGVTEQRVTK